MKYGNIKLPAVFLMLAVVAVSCAPRIHNIYFDMQKPALYQLDFEGKNIAVCVSLYGHDNAEDSSMKADIASGMAVQLEKEFSMEEGTVYVFNHYPPEDSAMSVDYILSLSRQVDSDLLIIVDTASAEPFTLIETNAIISDYALSAPYKSIIKVYDGITARSLARIEVVDTIYWELLTKTDILIASSLDRQSDIHQLFSKKVGESAVRNFFPSWDTYSRSIIVFLSSSWMYAAEYAEKFEWDKAIELWEAELVNKDAMKAAGAAMNIATACELTDRPELALEWLDYAGKVYNSGYKLDLPEYKLLLERKIEEQKR